ncbi:hypothetical protein ACP70R_038701 [Stipagrostis hirtigluma subsp. patula]
MDVEQQQLARRLLSHGAAAAVPSPGPTVQVGDAGARPAPFSSLDATVITILSLLLCGLVVVLAVHAVVRCAFRVTRRVCYGQEPPGGGEAASERASSCRAGTRRKGRSHCRLPAPVVYSPEVELAGCGRTECAICLAEFAHGERVRALPHCNHGFHVRCIDRWLAARQTCPTCRRAPFAKPALPEPGRPGAGAAPEAVQFQVQVEAGQPENDR